jgi:hypothetical protein
VVEVSIGSEVVCGLLELVTRSSLGEWREMCGQVELNVRQLEQPTQIAVIRGVWIASQIQRRGPLLTHSCLAGVPFDSRRCDERPLARTGSIDVICFGG